MQEQIIDLNSFFEISRQDIEKKITATISDKKIILILQDGKRLRPLLAHLVFKTCTQGKETPSQYQKALEGAVGIELAHSASLVHDDIIDKEKVRRGKTAFHVKEGVVNAILTGHKMLTAGFNIALNHGKDVAELFIESWNEVVSGELNEVNFNKNDIKNLKEKTVKSEIFETYKKIINMKTASLFSSACKAGALEANMTGDILKVFADYGREIGLAYQLADDLVDLVKGEMMDSVIIPLVNKLEGKNFNKRSLLKKKIIRKKLNKNLPEIKKLYIGEIRRHIQNAEKICNSDMIPQSHYKNILTDAPAWIINEMLKEINITI